MDQILKDGIIKEKKVSTKEHTGPRGGINSFLTTLTKYVFFKNR